MNTEATARDVEFEFDATSNGPGAGKETRSLSLKLDHHSMSPHELYERFVGMRLQLTIIEGHGGSDQQKLPGMEDAHASIGPIIADCKSASMKTGYWSLSLSFAKKAVSAEDLDKLTFRTVHVVVHELEEIPEGETVSTMDASHEDVGPDPAGAALGTAAATDQQILSAADEFAAKPIAILKDFGLKPGMIKNLLAANIKSVAHLEQFMRKSEYWHRDIKGMGEAKLTELMDAHLAFRLKYPIPDPTDVVEETDDESETESTAADDA